MSMANRNICSCAGFSVSWASCCPSWAGAGELAAETRLFSFTTSKGLAVKVLQDNDMPFIHAELLIFLDGSTQNYASLVISQLTVMNMFERELNSPPANLLDMLQRQGNDYQVEQNPEYVKISMNFLPDRLASFPKAAQGDLQLPVLSPEKIQPEQGKVLVLVHKKQGLEKGDRRVAGLPADGRQFLFHARVPAPGVPQPDQPGRIALVPAEDLPARQRRC